MASEKPKFSPEDTVSLNTELSKAAFDAKWERDSRFLNELKKNPKKSGEGNLEYQVRVFKKLYPERVEQIKKKMEVAKRSEPARQAAPAPPKEGEEGSKKSWQDKMKDYKVSPKIQDIAAKEDLADRGIDLGEDKASRYSEEYRKANEKYKKKLENLNPSTKEGREKIAGEYESLFDWDFSSGKTREEIKKLLKAKGVGLVFGRKRALRQLEVLREVYKIQARNLALEKARAPKFARRREEPVRPDNVVPINRRPNIEIPEIELSPKAGKAAEKVLENMSIEINEYNRDDYGVLKTLRGKAGRALLKAIIPLTMFGGVTAMGIDQYKKWKHREAQKATEVVLSGGALGAIPEVSLEPLLEEPGVELEPGEEMDTADRSQDHQDIKSLIEQEKAKIDNSDWKDTWDDVSRLVDDLYGSTKKMEKLVETVSSGIDGVNSLEKVKQVQERSKEIREKADKIKVKVAEVDKDGKVKDKINKYIERVVVYNNPQTGSSTTQPETEQAPDLPETREFVPQEVPNSMARLRAFLEERKKSASDELKGSYDFILQGLGELEETVTDYDKAMKGIHSSLDGENKNFSPPSMEKEEKAKEKLDKAKEAAKKVEEGIEKVKDGEVKNKTKEVLKSVEERDSNFKDTFGDYTSQPSETPKPKSIALEPSQTPPQTSGDTQGEREVKEIRERQEKTATPPQVEVGMEEKIDVDYKGESVGDFLEFLAQTKGLNLVVTDDIGVEMDTEVKINLSGISYQKALESVLAKPGLKWQVIGKDLRIYKDHVPLDPKRERQAFAGIPFYSADAQEIAQRGLEPAVNEYVKYLSGYNPASIRTVFPKAHEKLQKIRDEIVSQHGEEAFKQELEKHKEKGEINEEMSKYSLEGKFLEKTRPVFSPFIRKEGVAINSEQLPVVEGNFFSPDTVKKVEDYRGMVEQVLEEEGLGNQDVDLYLAMIAVESQGDPNAEAGGSQGLMGVEANALVDVNNYLEKQGKDKITDLTDPQQNIRAGVIYFGKILEKGRVWLNKVMKDKTKGVFYLGDNAEELDDSLKTRLTVYNGGLLATAQRENGQRKSSKTNDEYPGRVGKYRQALQKGAGAETALPSQTTPPVTPQVKPETSEKKIEVQTPLKAPEPEQSLQDTQDQQEQKVLDAYNEIKKAYPKIQWLTEKNLGSARFWIAIPDSFSASEAEKMGVEVGNIINKLLNRKPIIDVYISQNQTRAIAEYDASKGEYVIKEIAEAKDEKKETPSDVSTPEPKITPTVASPLPPKQKPPTMEQLLFGVSPRESVTPTPQPSPTSTPEIPQQPKDLESRLRQEYRFDNLPKGFSLEGDILKYEDKEIAKFDIDTRFDMSEGLVYWIKTGNSSTYNTKTETYGKKITDETLYNIAIGEGLDLIPESLVEGCVKEGFKNILYLRDNPDEVKKRLDPIQRIAFSLHQNEINSIDLKNDIDWDDDNTFYMNEEDHQLYCKLKRDIQGYKFFPIFNFNKGVKVDLAKGEIEWDDGSPKKIILYKDQILRFMNTKKGEVKDIIQELGL